jgi:TPP-dependent indolepyruvate ferredoxin oxidoreductase alpha subunit
MEILEDKPGKLMLLLGNEAITRGALEAGIDVSTTYPGTPASEIADTFSLIARFFTKLLLAASKLEVENGDAKTFLRS